MDERNRSSLEQLATGVTRGCAIALARSITIIENNLTGADELVGRLRAHIKGAPVIGVTGPPGAGKSTLINALVREVRKSNLRVAVLAVDPSSPVSGGAVLGDRVRMGEHSEDQGVFIRSLSARGHPGGLSPAIIDAIDLVDAAGWDLIIIETVGAGQSDTEIAAVADTRLVVMAPGLGDDVQAIKAGILEIADILIVNKADLDDARKTEQQLRAMLDLRVDGGKHVKLLKTIATRSEGIAGVLKAIESHACLANSREASHRRRRRFRAALSGLAAQITRNAIFGGASSDLEAIVSNVLDGHLSLRAAAPLAATAVAEAGEYGIHAGATPVPTAYIGKQVDDDE